MLLITTLLLLAPLSQHPESPRAHAEKAAFTADFGEQDSDLRSTGRNPFFVLEPGYVLQLEGEEKGEKVVSVITVLAETKRIAGVETRAVEERETVGGRLAEVTRDYFAISARTNNVYYFGEEVDVYRDGVVTSHEGSWLAGEKGARYGLAMPGAPLLGARYQQETAPEVAMDRGEVVATDEAFACPAGSFERVLVIEETTPLEKGKERKRYARGVGLLQDGELRLVRYGSGPH